jgi:hypothetical protein
MMESDESNDGNELDLDEELYLPSSNSALTRAPCLSFDIIKDKLSNRLTFPMSSLIVAGT